MESEKPGLSINAKIILGCTIALIIFLSGAMFFMWSYLQELTLSPFVYGAQKMSESNGGAPVMCSCQVQTFGKPGVQMNTRFEFNTSHVWNVEDYTKKSYLNDLPNISLTNVSLK